jgi:anti-sigma B factor antagonist
VDLDERRARVLRVVGELDLSRVGEIRELALNMLASPGCSTLNLCLDQVTFIDSTAIGMLVEIRNHASSAGQRMVLYRPSARVRRILEITALRDAFTIES